MTNDTSLESSCALLLESAKKIANLRKLNFLWQNQRYVLCLKYLTVGYHELIVYHIKTI